jgi:3'(2'), 5'-bisphosphate nucleotidase
VNIGLISDGVPLLGAVFAPARAAIYAGLVGKGAWMEDSGGRRPIRTRDRSPVITAVASKSHFSQPTADYLAAVKATDYVGIGSSLKFCIVAEGSADIYPRLSPTSEWDTAAAHAVLLAAGGAVDGPDGQPLRYGKRAFLNRGFVATGGWKAPAIGGFLQPFSGGGDLPAGT